MDVRDHGWFVFFAPHDKPEIAGVIFAEHAEHGYLGAPIAKYAMETYFAKKEGRPLPTLPPKPVAARIVAANRPAAGATSRQRHKSAELQFRVRDRLRARFDSAHVRTPIVLPRRLAAARRHSGHHRHRRGDDLQHHATCTLPEPGHPGPQFYTQIYAIGLGMIALLVCLAIDYRKLAESSLILYGGLIGAAHLRALPGVDAVQRHPLDRHRAVQPAAVGVRPRHGGADAGDVLRREPPRRAQRPATW